MTTVFDAYVCSVGYEDALDGELGRSQSRTPRWPAVVTRPAEPAPRDPVFARQRIPAATVVQGASVGALAAAAFDAVFEALAADESPWALHVFVPDQTAYRTIAGRAGLLEIAFLDRVRERRRKLLRARVQGGATRVVQLCLVGRTSLVVSVARPAALPHGGFDVAPWPAGEVAIADDKQAPSRAYRKLEEAFAWMGEAPRANERVVDLGGCPGGWAWKALERGAFVTAVDRAPLLPPAAGHPRLTMVLGNAFTWQPPAPLDWLLCDVICEPERTIELVSRWMGARLCRRMVATIKFKGRHGYDLLVGLPARLAERGATFVRIKHLANNKNEVELMAKV